MLYCFQSTTEQIKEDVTELKEVVKEVNQTAKADRSKKFSNIEEMKDQLAKEVSELKQQSAAMFDYLKQMSFRLDSLMAANDTSKTRTKLMDEDELNEYALDSSQHKVSSSSSNPDDDDDNKWDD